MKPIFFESKKIWDVLSARIPKEELKLDVEIHKKLLEIFNVGDYYCFVFNLTNTSFDWVSEEIETVLGYKASETSVPFFLDKIHPEDQPWFLNFENKVIEFFAALRPDQIPNYKVRYDYRIRKNNGEYIRILQQVITIQHSDTGALLRTFVVHTDISHLKKEGLPLLSFIGLNDEPSYINIDVKNKFTPSQQLISVREKEVLHLIIQGHHSNSIADILFISKETVDRHRKNMLRKINVSNTAQLIATAIRKGII